MIVRFLIGVIALAWTLYFVWFYAAKMTLQQAKVVGKGLLFLGISCFLVFLFVQLF